ncbi:glycosyltransferase family 2 protein [Candidatus Poribacteria bacterium]|nr:glycosyltransferase family 2 protein [Candidatus Poribacteria bacterium]MYI93489.1 glycosyltransferase family 2 protein [Candidatus Poribacteria bacterium]
MLVSVIIPAYNEEQTIRQVLESVQSLPFEKQIIVVNDGSTDKTYTILQKYADEFEITLVNCEKNSGKGFAIRSGIPYVKGKIVVIQDADMELSPSDIVELVRPLKTETAKVVYGSRFLNGRQNASLQNYIANRILAIYTNILYGSKITDESTGYKAFSSDVIRKLNLTCEGFEFCPEVTAKLLRAGFDIHEVPVSYFPRTKKEGKKLRFWSDGIFAAWTLLKYRFTTQSKLFKETTEE